MKTNLWPYITPGIPDELFHRDKIPMTKEEIRTVTLAKARLTPKMVVWDVGAGTGSLTVETARLVTGGTVYAVEKEPRGIKLIVENARRFALNNVVPVAGEAPAALNDLPAPDRVLVGGSGGFLPGILEQSMQRLKPGGRIVVNAVTLETLVRMTEPQRGWHYEMTQLQVSRAVPAGKVHMWRSLNPVYIVTLDRDVK